MPPELPGFYFDPEKNRYFPIKHRAAGAGQIHKTKAISSSLALKCESQKRKRAHKFGSAQLLSRRELAGRSLPSGVCNSVCFQREYMESQASFPKVWIYENTNDRADGAVEQFHATMETLEGSKNGNFLAVGGTNGCLGLYEFMETKQQLEYEVMNRPYPFGPQNSDQKNATENPPSPICSKIEPAVAFASSITAIKKLGKRAASTNDDGMFLHEGALFTTLGSGSFGGSLYVLRLNKPVDLYSALPLERIVEKCISTSSSVWTADSNFDGTRAVIGTNQGAGLVDIERKKLSWVCHSNSDILSQQFDQSGNLVFCGLRNGLILTVDTRKEQSATSGLSASVHGNRILHATSRFSDNDGDQHLFSGKFRFKGNVNLSDTIRMPSAVCSLTVLHSDETYLLASSMNGTMKLWDRRLVQRGAVQSYEGQVNSHTTMQIAVDPTETLLASGGEDCAIRLWSVKTGELLHTADGACSPVRTVCWPKCGRLRELYDGRQFYEDAVFDQDFCWGLWLGSSEGLLYMHGGA